MVSMAELQTVLQGLEERLMRRLTPIGQSEIQEAKLPTASVSTAELQASMQSLEERLMRRLPPTGQSEIQEAKLPTALVSAAELQASIQSLEERLTQRLQYMLSQTPEPVRVGQRLPQQVLASAQPPLVVEAAQPVSLLMVPYLLVLTNALFLLLAGVLLWLWWRRRDRVERMQGV